MTSRTFTILAAGLLTVCCMAYILYLAASWNAYQTDRAKHTSKIDEMLDRLPPRKVADDHAS